MNSNKGKKQVGSILSGVKWSGLNSVSMAFVKVIRGAVIPKILHTPQEYGLFSSVGIFSRYLQFSDFGARAYLSKVLPHQYFNEEDESTQRLLDQVFSFIVFSFLLIIIYLTILSYFYKGNSQSFYKSALIALIPSTIFMKLREYYSTIANSIQNYRLSSSTGIYSDLLSLLLVVGGVYFYGAIGGIYAQILVELVLFIYIFNKIKIKNKIILSFQIFQNIKAYLKLFSILIIEVINNTLDQIFILWFFTHYDYGVYALGTAFGWVMIAISGVFVTSLQPKIMAFRIIDSKRVERYLHDSILIFLLFCLLVIPFLAIGLTFFIKVYLTAFMEGLKIYLLLIFSSLIRSCIILIRTFYIAKNKELFYVKLSVFNVLLISLIYLAGHFIGLSFFSMIYAFIVGDMIIFLVNYKFITDTNFFNESFKSMGTILFTFALVIIYVSFDANITTKPISILVVLSLCLLISGFVLLLLFKNKNKIMFLLYE